MNEIIKNIEAAELKAEVPVFNVGDTVKVYAKIKEGNRERIQIFEGTVLKKRGWKQQSNFHSKKRNPTESALKNMAAALSPNVEKIEVIRRGKVRRAKLNYLRDRVGKKQKVKELVK